MARPSKRPKTPPFVALPFNLLNHPAYMKLKPSSAKVLPYFFGKVKVPWNDIQRHQTTFPFSYTEAARYGFATATFSAAIKDLVALGFVDPVERGGLRGMGRTTSQFRLSPRWKEYGKPGFVEVRWEGFEKTDATSKSEVYNCGN